MNLNEYQEKAKLTDLDLESAGEVMEQGTLNTVSFINKVLGVTGETGEFSDKIKKVMRDKKGVFTEEDREEILKELGDVLWYVALVSLYLGMPLEDLAKMNLDKLASRRQRGTLKGSGDNR